MGDSDAMADAGTAQALACLQAAAQFFRARLLAGQPLRGCLQHGIPVHGMHHVGAKVR